MVSELVDPSEYDPLYLAGVLKFNECDYYECHEVCDARAGNQSLLVVDGRS